MRKDDWFVAWVASGREQALLAQMRDIPGIAEALCPRRALWRRKGGVWLLKEELLFPGYIFLRCGMTGQVYHAVKALPGVLDWLGQEDGPSSVREEEMARVLALARDGEPHAVLEQVALRPRQRRGYGVLTLQGRRFRVAFNVYDDKQAEQAAGDSSPLARDAEHMWRS